MQGNSKSALVSLWALYVGILANVLTGKRNVCYLGVISKDLNTSWILLVKHLNDKFINNVLDAPNNIELQAKYQKRKPNGDTEMTFICDVGVSNPTSNVTFLGLEDEAILSQMSEESQVLHTGGSTKSTVRENRKSCKVIFYLILPNSHTFHW